MSWFISLLSDFAFRSLVAIKQKQSASDSSVADRWFTFYKQVPQGDINVSVYGAGSKRHFIYQYE